MSRTNHKRHPVRGFTLVELMIAVVIIGVLATIAMVSYRRFVGSSKNTEASSMLQSIRAAEESYRAEAMTYLNVSTSGNFYPQNASTFSTSTFNTKKWAWVNPAASDINNWKILGATSDGPVAFGYRARAGAAGTIPPAPLFAVGGWPTTATAEPWYMVEAMGDPDGDGTQTMAVTSSFSGEIFWKNP